MKKIFNPESTEVTHKIIGGDPSGIANFSKPSRVIYKTIYEGMLDRTWFPSQVDLSDDIKAMLHLTEEEVRFYELTFGKLIFNDSVITNRIMDNFNQYITDPIANACLARQAFEESLHSQSYAFIGDDVLQKANGDSEKVYNLFKTDDMLLELASNINADYGSFDDGTEVEAGHLALGAIANLALEGVSFPAGFLAIWSLGDKMKGSASMITEISKDELGSHLPLYVNLYNHIHTDAELDKPKYDKMAKEMLIRATEREIKFLKYSSEGVLGFSDPSIENFMHWVCNERFRELGFELHYSKADTTDGLVKIFKNYSQLNDTKTNFFEGTVKTYSKQNLDMDF
ncbi:MAG: ribonucleotide-diphosphate reductase subunit beta [Sulfurimonas sp.]|nr:ribonucleotide-diphosphate reductase subunit beta [Sulfurimonas sp.]